VVRGLIRPGFEARAGLKVADLDPRCEPAHCLTVSDKARAIAGGVLEALLLLGAP
jgi:xanthine dehydrogenase accessory factor